jgi:hypothetical protein
LNSFADVVVAQNNTEELLKDIFVVKKGRPAVNESVPSVRKRMKARAKKVANLFTAVLAVVNRTHNYQLCPLTVNDVLAESEEGAALLAQTAVAAETRALATSARNMTTAAGRATKGTLAGIVAFSSDGILSSSTVASITGFHPDYVRRLKRSVSKEDYGTLGGQSKRGKTTEYDTARHERGKFATFLADNPDNTNIFTRYGGRAEAVKWLANMDERIRGLHTTARAQAWGRRTIPETEKAATGRWMMEENPARSGDQKAICWMTESKADYYYDTYRSVDGFTKLIETALQDEEYGADLKEAALYGRGPKNGWLRNVKKYLDAKSTSNIGRLRIKPMCDAPNTDQISDSVVTQACEDERKHHKNKIVEREEEDETEEDEDEEAERDEDAEEEDEEYTLIPRAYQTFYNTILKGVRLWQLPPHDTCSRCEEFVLLQKKIKDLQHALGGLSTDLDSKANYDLIESYGGEMGTHATLRKEINKLPNLKQHVEWKASGRGYKMQREKEMENHECMCDCDFGGFTDSEGKKMSVWGVTVVTAGRLTKPYHIDIFFDAANQVEKRPGAKKNGPTGIYCWEEMLDPAKDPKGEGICMFKRIFPDVTHLILSGDTGNGYRAYEMLEALSGIFNKFGYTVELMNLPPAHAHNRTDARIARQNTFLNKTKNRARVYGAEQTATAFRKACDPAISKSRKFMARSWIFFRVIPQTDEDERERLSANYGGTAKVMDPRLAKGSTGVRGLLYFDFSFISKTGLPEHPEGYARVRVNGDPNMRNNPTFVYTWRKDFCKLMCQPCSNESGLFYAPLPRTYAFPGTHKRFIC